MVLRQCQYRPSGYVQSQQLEMHSPPDSFTSINAIYTVNDVHLLPQTHSQTMMTRVILHEALSFYYIHPIVSSRKNCSNVQMCKRLPYLIHVTPSSTLPAWYGEHSALSRILRSHNQNTDLLTRKA